MDYIVDREKWLKDDVAQVRALTYAIDATTDGSRIPQNLKEIEALARRARQKYIDLKLDKD